MTPLNMMSASAINGATGMAVPASASGELNLDLSADEFDQLVEQMVGDTGEAMDDHQRLNMLRDAIEDMDGSEILGFLAMLENQSGWQADKTSILNAADITATAELVENSLLLEAGASQPQLNQQAALYQTLVPDSPQGSEVLQEALAGALDKAFESYLPASRDSAQHQAGLPAELSVEPGNQVLMNLADAEQQVTVNNAVSHDAEALKLDAQIVRSESLLNFASTGPVQTGLDLSVQNAGAIASSAKQQTVAAENASADSRVMPNIQDERWGDALGQRLAMMVTDQRQEAVMRLDPPELGTLGVRLVVENGSVSVQFTSAVPQVREMLEIEADRLRDAIESEGLELADVNVGQGEGDSRQQESSLYAENGQETGFEVTAEPDAMDTQWTVTDIHVPLSRGLISTYA